MRKAFFRAVLFILCVGTSWAAIITFDDLANGTAVTGLGDENVEINAWVDFGINHLAPSSWTEAGIIQDGAILAEGRMDMSVEENSFPFAYISARFLVPVSDVTLDVRRDQVYGIGILVLGESGEGTGYTERFDVPGWDFHQPDWRSHTFTAPDGGRISRIQLHMWDDMHTSIGADNISYTVVPESGTASLFAVGFVTLWLLRRKNAGPL